MLKYIFVNNTRRSLDKDPRRADIHSLINEREEARRDDFLIHQNSKVAAQLGFNALRMQDEFAKQKKELPAMNDRFKLAFTEPYVENVSTVELGVTSSPEDIQQIDALKDHYGNLLQWLVDEHYTKGEISRENSERIFTVESVPAHPEQVVVSRSRQLLVGEVPVDSGRIQFGITKRMVLGMPGSMYVLLADDDRLIKNEATKRRFERQIDSNHHLIDPIRTAYYLGIDTRLDA